MKCTAVKGNGMKTKKKNVQKFLRNSFKCIEFFVTTNPIRTYIYILSTVMYAFIWVLQTMSLQWFFDAVTYYGNGEQAFSRVIGTLGVMALVYLVYHILDGVNNCYPEILEIQLRKSLNISVYKKIGELDLLSFEDTKRLESVEKAIQGSGNLVWVGFALLDIIFYYIAYFIFISWYLFTLKPMLIFCVVLIFIPCIISRFVNIKFYKNLEEQISPLRRELHHYEETLVDKKYFKETRLLGIEQQQLEKYNKVLKEINDLNYLAEKRKAFIDVLMKIITIIGYALILLMLFLFVMNEEISIGAFAAVLASLNSIYRFMSKLIFERLGWALENFGTVENTLDLLAIDMEESSSCQKPFNIISLENVSFKYPQSDHEFLTDINLEIKKGESIAIVGINGSGKSTLSKIILGLYKVSTGKILIDAQNSRHSELKKKSAIFQDFAKYQMSLKDNIMISQMDDSSNIDKIMNVIEQSGVNNFLKKFPQNIDTMLGKEFDGIDLSGGQWQRVAIARGLFKNHELIILDEPTAAIDPIEERNLYEKFQEICRNKTAIMITHRIGSAKMADRIVVMKEGKIVQEGHHRELIDIEGEYRKLYQEQSKWY